MASVSSLHSKCFSAVQGVKEWGGAGQQEKVDLWGLWGGCKRTRQPPPYGPVITVNLHGNQLL